MENDKNIWYYMIMGEIILMVYLFLICAFVLFLGMCGMSEKNASVIYKYFVEPFGSIFVLILIILIIYAVIKGFFYKG